MMVIIILEIDKRNSSNSDNTNNNNNNNNHNDRNSNSNSSSIDNEKKHNNINSDDCNQMYLYVCVYIKHATFHIISGSVVSFTGLHYLTIRTTTFRVPRCKRTQPGTTTAGLLCNGIVPMKIRFLMSSLYEIMTRKGNCNCKHKQRNV